MLTLILHQGDERAVEDWIAGTFDFIEYEDGKLKCLVQENTDSEPQVWAIIATNRLHQVLVDFGVVHDARWPGRVQPLSPRVVLYATIIQQ